MAPVAGFGFQATATAESKTELIAYVLEESVAPSPIAMPARAQAGRMFADIGISIQWRSGPPHASVPRKFPNRRGGSPHAKWFLSRCIGLSSLAKRPRSGVMTGCNRSFRSNLFPSVGMSTESFIVLCVSWYVPVQTKLAGRDQVLGELRAYLGRHLEDGGRSFSRKTFAKGKTAGAFKRLLIFELNDKRN
jgi:hypothetical protein